MMPSGARDVEPFSGRALVSWCSFPDLFALREGNEWGVSLLASGKRERALFPSDDRGNGKMAEGTQIFSPAVTGFFAANRRPGELSACSAHPTDERWIARPVRGAG